MGVAGTVQSTLAQVAAAQATPSDKAAYASFALQAEGDVANGRLLFSNPARTACTMCHTVDGSRGLAGPDLSAIGDKFPRRELIQSVLEPSSTIAVGYGTTVITRKSGDEVVGVIKQASDTWTELMGADGKPVRIESSDVAGQRTSPASLMPEGLCAGLSAQEFADLVSYLQSLRQAGSAQAAGRGAMEDVQPAKRQVTLEPFFRSSIKLDRPLWFGEIPGRSGSYAVLEHFGGSWIVEKGPTGETQRPLLDLRSVVRRGGASGLLGMAFHPKFPENRKYYLKYQIEENGRISTLIVERRFSEDWKGDSGEPARQLFKIPSTTQDHQGGCLEFGPDGFLYIGMGDTGPQGDPQGHGQDMGLLLGKLLRIDVDHQEDGLPYAIPADNPFRGQAGTRPEIWAFGFREPWRFTFDSQTKDLWLGDVGQDRFEEVGIVRAGENHGWNVFEGANAFSDRYRREGTAFVPPVFSYPHRLGVSVTGGFVYRGQRAPAMRGWYVFADFETRRIWALTQKDRTLQKIVEIGRAPTRAASFAQGRDGELYLVGYDLGVIYHVGLESVDPTPLESRFITETSEKNPVSWRFSLQNPGEGWEKPQYDDAAWTQAPGGFGTRGTPGAIVRTEWRSGDIWLRHEFTVPDATVSSKRSSLALRVHHDEDAEIYLNGVCLDRLPRWTSGYIDVPLTDQAIQALRPGRNVLSVHCHQNTGGQYIDAGIVEYVEPAS